MLCPYQVPTEDCLGQLQLNWISSANSASTQRVGLMTIRHPNAPRTPSHNPCNTDARNFEAARINTALQRRATGTYYRPSTPKSRIKQDGTTHTPLYHISHKLLEAQCSRVVAESKRNIHSMGKSRSRPRVKPVIDTSQGFFASESMIIKFSNHETNEWEGGIQA